VLCILSESVVLTATPIAWQWTISETAVIVREVSRGIFLCVGEDDLIILSLVSWVGFVC